LHNSFTLKIATLSKTVVHIDKVNTMRSWICILLFH